MRAVKKAEPEDAMKTLLFALGSVVWMYLIYYFSSITGEQLGPDTLLIIMIKKSGHAVIFGVLAALYLYTFKGGTSLPETRGALFLLSLFLVLLYSVSDEYHQSFTPGRHSSGKDVMIDVCGALTMLITLYVFKTRIKGKY